MFLNFQEAVESQLEVEERDDSIDLDLERPAAAAPPKTTHKPKTTTRKPKPTTRKHNPTTHRNQLNKFA